MTLMDIILGHYFRHPPRLVVLASHGSTKPSLVRQTLQAAGGGMK